MVFNSSMLMAGATANASGYSITNSARFVSGNSAKLTRTPGVAGNRRLWTLSTWVKRSKLSSTQTIFSAWGANTDAGNFVINFNGSDKIDITMWSLVGYLTTAVYRDTSAWYHIVLAVDTDNATANNRWRLYVNGSEVTTLDTRNNPTINQDMAVNNTVLHSIGVPSNLSAQYFDGYQSNTYFIDGQALTPSSFGQTNTSGVWVPKAYSGTYGTNGFLMEFKNSAALGTDTSGNGNTFTSSGLVAGDCMNDTPTLNYCTLNPLDDITTGQTLSSGNLIAQWVSPNQRTIMGTLSASSGKFYWEYVWTAGQIAQQIGVMPIDRATRGVAYTMNATNGIGNQAVAYDFYDGNKLVNGTRSAYGATVGLGVVIGVALNLDAQQVTFYKANVSQGVINLPVAGKNWAPAFGQGGDYNTNTANFGATAFTYTPPTGYVALNSSNLPAPAIKDGSAHFQTTLYTGNNTTNVITQTGNSQFTPDLLWAKRRSVAQDHVLFNVLRGVTKSLSSSLTTAEQSSTTALASLNSNGFTLGVDDLSVYGAINTAHTFAAWQWKAGGAGVSNTSGSITSTVSANTTAGCSIVTWTAAAANATVGHGLGAAPTFLIARTIGSVVQWRVYHASIGATKYGKLNLTDTFNADSAQWNDTAPTSTVFSVGGGFASGLSIAYCFTPIAGFSAFGSYTGNGAADGPFIYTGFKPAWVMVKRTDSTSNWVILDTARDTYNVANKDLNADSAVAENANQPSVDILSNGFKLRLATSNPNASAATYIYAAFASNPFGGSGAVPATAR